MFSTRLHSQKKKGTKAVTGAVPFQKFKKKKIIPKGCILVP